MAALNFVVLLFCTVLSTALYAAETEDRTNYENYEYYLNEFNLLQHYKLMYPDEERIFNYCVEKYKKEPGSYLPGSYRPAPFGGYAIGTKVGSCLQKQIKLKNQIIDNARDHLGGQTQAKAMYDECSEYYSRSGAATVGRCVKTRLVLDGMLDDDIVENKIYKNCDLVWRKHGHNAIDNCSRNDAYYYLRKGRLRD